MRAGPARSRRNAVHRPGRDGRAGAVRAATPDRHLPARKRLEQGDRTCAPAGKDHRRIAGRGDRAVLLRAGRAGARGEEFQRSARALEQAFESQPESVRALYRARSSGVAARPISSRRDAFERVATLDVDYVPEVLPQLLDCYARLEQMQRAEKFLLDQSTARTASHR